jgi:hypothetical protein
LASDHLRLWDLPQRVRSTLTRRSEPLDVEVALAAFCSVLTIAEVYGAADVEAHARVV